MENERVIWTPKYGLIPGKELKRDVVWDIKPDSYIKCTVNYIWKDDEIVLTNTYVKAMKGQPIAALAARKSRSFSAGNL